HLTGCRAGRSDPICLAGSKSGPHVLSDLRPTTPVCWSARCQLREQRNRRSIAPRRIARHGTSRFVRSVAMPKGPQGQKRPADVIGNAVRVMRIATGEEIEEADSVKSAAAELGSR